MKNQHEYITLTRAELQAIASRAAELAIEQAFAQMVPRVSPPTFRLKHDNQSDRQLTQWERDAMAKIFE